MRLFLRYAFLLFSLSTHAQSIIYVTETGRGDRSGTSWDNAIPGTFLAGRVATAPSDTQFWVAAGTYRPTTTTNRSASFKPTNGIRIYGGFEGTETSIYARQLGMFETILSGDIGTANIRDDNSKQVFLAADISGTLILDQITIQDAYASDGVNSGAGMYVTAANASITVQITNCRFNNNIIPRSLNGGGALAVMSRSGGIFRLLVEGSTFLGSEAGFGGAVNLYTQGGKLDATIRTSTFERNLANEGGAISGRYLEPGPGNRFQINRCTFNNNQAYNGGAIATGPANSSATNCRFLSNTTTAIYGNGGGGAIDLSNATTSFTNCLFAGNETGSGGVAVSTTDGAPVEAIFTNCTFANNKAARRGGVVHISKPSYALTTERTVQFVNCIAWGNTATDGTFFTSDIPTTDRAVTPKVTYSLIEGGGYPGPGNSSADPLFANSAISNYRLTIGSPALNAGDPTRPYAASDTDLDGNPRLRGGRIDIGAYEFDCDSQDCNSVSSLVESIQSGAWNHPSTWSCNCVPDRTQPVQIWSNHTITLPNAYTGQARSIKLIGSGAMRVQGSGTIKLYKQ